MKKRIAKKIALRRLNAATIEELETKLTDQTEETKQLLEIEHQRYEKKLEKNNRRHEERYNALQRSYMNESRKHSVTKNILERKEHLLEALSNENNEMAAEITVLKEELGKYKSNRLVKLFARW